MESQFLNITHIRDLTISIDFNNLNIMKALKIKIEIKILKTICKFSQEKNYRNDHRNDRCTRYPIFITLSELYKVVLSTV